MTAPEQFGTVEVLLTRVYNTERGEYAVRPGIYPMVRHASGHVTWLLQGRRTDQVEPSTERIGDGMFVLRPGGDVETGEATSFPYGYWTPAQFADLLDDPVAAEGHPMQRLRFRHSAQVSR